MVVSTDQSGSIEIWDPETYQMPEEGTSKLKFELMSETDLYDLVTSETFALSM